MLNTSETASLLLADHGADSFTTETGTVLTGAFTIGSARRDESLPRGDDAVISGTLLLPAAAVVREQNLLTRVKDGTVWEVSLAPPPEHGLRAIDLRCVRAISRGAF
jgi:hypothetical protein